MMVLLIACLVKDAENVVLWNYTINPDECVYISSARVKVHKILLVFGDR